MARRAFVRFREVLAAIERRPVAVILGAAALAVAAAFGLGDLAGYERVRRELGRLDPIWLGRELSLDMLADFERLGVDPCGERGEYHTVVTDCALFSAPLDLVLGSVVLRSGCWALDVS